MEFYESFYAPGFIFIVMELMVSGELLDVLYERNSFSSKDAASLVNQILAGVEYMHHNGITHRDL